MKKGLISIGILAGFLLSILMVSGVFAKDVVEYNPAYGKVTFTHKKHVESEDRLYEMPPHLEEGRDHWQTL